MNKNIDIEDIENEDENACSIICRVWSSGCPHPELCQDECFDNDIVRPRKHIELE